MNAPGRLTRTGWLDLALSRLSEAGPEALKLDAICAAAGKTKGSFYHHFVDHDAFLMAVTERWIDVQTERLTQKFPSETLRESDLKALMDEVMHLDLRLEGAIRHLGETHGGVARLVRQTDARRVTFAAEVYVRRFDLDPALARDLARLDYAALLGLMMIAPDMTPEEHLRLYDLYDDMVRARFGPSRLESDDA